MLKRNLTTTTLLLVAVGCSARAPDTAAKNNSPYPIPDAVIAIAGPDQDLMTARLDPTDQCYWYYHTGRIETTLVPLRAANGNQICNARTDGNIATPAG